MKKYGKYSFMIDLDEVCFLNIDTEKKKIYVVFKNGHTEFLQFPEGITEQEIGQIGREMYREIENTKYIIRG